ncbi:hypothetical protein CAL11_08625 [Bordetella genomosp. 6]|nr:hypothetical protein CAL11_08625 [Bordetella genomosp. 6]
MSALSSTSEPRHKAGCEDSIGCMHGSSEPDLRNWKSPNPQFTQEARPDTPAVNRSEIQPGPLGLHGNPREHTSTI